MKVNQVFEIKFAYKGENEKGELSKKKLNVLAQCTNYTEAEKLAHTLIAIQELEKFEECMDQLAEYDPKTYVTIYKDLTKHMIPKQSEVSVTHGLDEDFKQLAALAQTKTDNNALDVTQVPQITDADFEELKELGDGIS